MLRILQTTDLHVQIAPYDYFADQPAPTTGLALTATLIREMRAGAENCLLLDDGDFLQGNPMSDWAADMATAATGTDAPPPSVAGTLHPMIAAMNALRFDGGTLGNHEFNYGLPFLEQTLATAAFPVVSANVVRRLGASPHQDTPFLPPWHILSRQFLTDTGETATVKIGIIGFAPPQFAQWERFTLNDTIAARDIVGAARAHIGGLRAAGADLVIALCHSGIEEQVATPWQENAALPLAEVPGVDVVLAGHQHKVFPGPDFGSTEIVDPVRGTLHGKPAVMAGCYGSHLGVIDLVLVQQGGVWSIADHRAEAHPVARRNDLTGRTEPLVAPDAEILALVAVDHARVLAEVRQPVSRTSAALSTHFAFVAPSTALSLIADLIGGWVAEQDLTPADRALPLVVAVAPYKAGGMSQPGTYVEISPGPLVVRHASELYPYPNRLCVLRLSGADVVNWLETAARAFATVIPGATDQPLRNLAVPAYNFDTLHGLRYRIDPSQPTGRRISDLRLASGEALTPNRPVLIAANSYRAAGGGDYACAARAILRHKSQVGLRDILLDQLRGKPVHSPVAEPVWRFAPLPGTAAWIDNGPRSGSWLPGGQGGCDAVGLTDLGLTEARLRRWSVGFAAR